MDFIEVCKSEFWELLLFLDDHAEAVGVAWAVFAAFQSNTAVKTSNKQEAFSRRMEIYLPIRDMFMAYELIKDKSTNQGWLSGLTGANYFRDIYESIGGLKEEKEMLVNELMSLKEVDQSEELDKKNKDINKIIVDTGKRIEKIDKQIATILRNKTAKLDEIQAAIDMLWGRRYRLYFDFDQHNKKILQFDKVHKMRVHYIKRFFETYVKLYSALINEVYGDGSNVKPEEIQEMKNMLEIYYQHIEKKKYINDLKDSIRLER